MLSRRERFRFLAAGSALAVSVSLALVAARGPQGASASESKAEAMRCAYGVGRVCAEGGVNRMSARGTVAPALRTLAQPYGIRLGTAVNSEALLRDPPYAAILAREFGTVTPEDAMKWGRLEQSPGVYNWSAADQLVDFAARTGQQVYGHTLVWHEATPAWLTAERLPRDEAAELLRRHITDVVTHFRGRVWAWDVVNEPLEADGSVREALWSRSLGPDYIVQSLHLARAADPAVRLFVNDYGIEGINRKSDALYAMVQRWRAAGVPIDGIGFQTHTTTSRGLPSTFVANLQRFAALGLDVAITEADVRIPLPVTPEKLVSQARIYGDAVRACLAVSRCVSFTVWGFSDRYSWVPTVHTTAGAACVMDSDLRPKPAYDALTAAFPKRPNE
jgi:endo-1,4-beta-xylanase